VTMRTVDKERKAYGPTLCDCYRLKIMNIFSTVYLLTT